MLRQSLCDTAKKSFSGINNNPINLAGTSSLRPSVEEYTVKINLLFFGLACSSGEYSRVVSWLEKKIGLLLVCSRVPSFDTSIARAKIEARKKGLALTVKCSKHDCAIADVTGGK